MSSPEHKEKVWDLIRHIKTGMLTTLHGEELRARPMHLVQDEYDGTLWFFTDLESEKVFEVENDSDVCVAFADTHDDTYVSMTGVGRIVKDKALIDKFWNPFIGAWFPDGKGSPNVGLIEIKIQKGEYWNSDTSKMVSFFKMAKANAKDETPNMGEHEKFGTS
ncbi:pyridoxamine 5'-phosphate oxidase family protein [Marinobacter nanhaiticus D15-8W]|uniref:Pyridoxamine 5'-phosphate oxidase n=1 Tax=Marinobacter nanhaiticus D15-8W TaxID=626887 RepID=N6WVH7_9GAMM|nr:pyridoxamine 5'-phosphate oxidase family protein [Marinobacter nanhaiticus]ENO12848.1 pyridoxamine 5'-phosphate oxidase [Marinobacter nanhaiticus D15-8W]BES70198.1 pyridoxamine 5'-phosphate oxidase family protein [Marinobacter nanhaiticus D15-8W]